MPDLRYPAFVLALGEMPTRFFCYKDGTTSPSFSTKSGGTDILIDAYVEGKISAKQLRWGMKQIDESELKEELPKSDIEQGFQDLPPGEFIQ